MSAFEVNVTPTRLRNVKLRTEAREPTIVVMAPFSAKAIVVYEDIPVSKTAKRFLTVNNPTSIELKISVTKFPNQDLNMSADWTSTTIQPNSDISMELSWSPLKEISCKEILQLTDSRGFKKDIVIILKSIDKNKQKKVIKKVTTQSVALATKKKKIKTPSPPPKRFVKKSPLVAGKRQVVAQKWQPLKQSEKVVYVEEEQNLYHMVKEEKSPLKPRNSNLKMPNQDITNPFDVSNAMSFNFSMFSKPEAVKNKENHSPTPSKSLAFLDQLKFTPVTETKSKVTSVLYSMAEQETPGSFKREKYTFARNELPQLNLLPSLSDLDASSEDSLNSKSDTNIMKSDTNVNNVEVMDFGSVKETTYLAHMMTPMSKVPKTPISNNEVFATPMRVLVGSDNSSGFDPSIFSTVSKQLKNGELSQIHLAELESKRKLFYGSGNETFDLRTKSGSVERLSSETYSKGSLSPGISPKTNIITSVIPEFDILERNDVDNHKSLSELNALSMILEEETRGLGVTFSESVILEKTFPINKTITTIVKQNSDDSITNSAKKSNLNLTKTPLRKIVSEQNLSFGFNNVDNNIKLNQGSMPNLNDIDQQIEHNRYFYQSTEKSSIQTYGTTSSSMSSGYNTTSTIDLLFKPNEICAQSSRFNVNESHKDTTMRNILNNSDDKRRQQTIFKNESELPKRLYKTQSVDITPERKNHYRSHSNKTPNRITASDDCFKHPGKNTLMFMSPPSKNKFSDEVFDIQNRPKYNLGREIRTNRWGAVQAKKINPKVPIQQLTLRKTTPKKAPAERVILYDSDLHIKAFINPDPFAATTTCDPYLSCTMFLDERAVDRHEREFKKWLNALVTLPAELDVNTTQQVDYGRLFNEVRNKELSLAPTKETVSSKYFTKYRLESLRKAAIALFTSEELSLPFAKVAVQIEKKQLTIRDNRDLHLDLVLQRDILELLLCFNPLWLRVGLEVTFGEQIQLHSNSDIYGLSTFIVNRLFRDKYLEQKYSKAYTQSSSYSDQMKKFTLKKFLFLLLFLDTAKNKKMIAHNPCLFVKNAPYKETKDILSRFASQLIANIGDVSKNLRRLGYVLTHKQTYLDEFNYAFNNLAVDLRDGVRLTKVMEIILMRDNLTEKLRAPAISRLQKVYNVDLALKALADADFHIAGDITAKDISDGHREKTLSLLWQIIYKFRAPKFINAANIIQLWWRKSWLKVYINRRIKEKLEMRRNNAATLIQAAYRGYLSRKDTYQLYMLKSNACIIIQKYFRRYIAIRNYSKTINCIIIIQKWYRITKATQLMREEFLIKRKSVLLIQTWYRRHKFARKLELAAPLIKLLKGEAKLHYENAVIIQKTLKSYMIRKKFRTVVQTVMDQQSKSKHENICVTKIQSLYRMKRDRNEFLIKRKACITVQTYYRAYIMMKKQRNSYLLLKKSTIIIQKHFVAYLMMRKQHSEYLMLKTKTIKIQQIFRANKTMSIDRFNYVKLRSSTVMIQQQFRALLAMRIDRHNYLKLKETTINMQQKYRANKIMIEQRSYFLQLKTYTIFIQRKFLANLLMKKQYEYYIKLKYVTIKIQHIFRAKVEGRKQRESYLQIKYATTVLQTRYRANQLMKQQRNIYLRQKSAATTIANQWIAIKLMREQNEKYKTMKKAAILIQNKFRATQLMKQERIQYLHLQYLTIFIQRQYRANCLMKEQRIGYLQLKKYTIIVQRRYHAKCLMKKARNDYLQMKNAAICVQSHYRALIQMRNDHSNYLLLKKATVCIQQKYRAQLQMRYERKIFMLKRNAIIFLQNKLRAKWQMDKDRAEFQKLKNAAICLQRYYRGKLSMKIAHENYLLIKKSTISIQQYYRATILMRTERSNYLALRNAAIIIQKAYRNKKLMQTAMKNYSVIREKVIFVQQKYRSILLVRKIRENYLNKKNAANTIQKHYRNYQLMRKEQSLYLLLKKSTILIQQRYRAKLLRRNAEMNFIMIKKASIVIQRKYRSLILMRKIRNEFLLQKNAVKTIEKHYFGKKLMEANREEYLKKKSAIILIQKYYRLTITKRIVQNNYIRLKETTIFIQQKFRAKLAMRKEFNHYQKLKAATILIQNYYRNVCIMRYERNKFLQMKNAAIVIQSRLRAFLVMRQVKNQYLLLRCLIICLQRKYRANIAMINDRNNYQKLRNAVILIQQRYREKRLMIQQYNEYNIKRNLVVKLHMYVRGYLARQRYQAMLTPEMLEQKLRNKAAKKIQCMWRGYIDRKNNQTKSMRTIAKRLIYLNRNVKQCNTLRHKLHMSIKFLKGRFNIQEALIVLTKLENMSRFVPHILIEHARFISTFCYGIMAQAIRSEADKQVIELCGRIILNLARYEYTKEVAFQEYGLETLAQMLIRWCDKETGIFNTLCTLVWVFAHCPDKKLTMRSYLVSREAIYTLRETKKLVLRKQNMRKNVSRNIQGNHQTLSLQQQRQLPSLKPDFGVVKNHSYIFNCSVFAFDTLLSKLEIDRI